MTITVLLVDDHELIREGLRRAFEREDDIQVVGEAASVAEGIAMGRKTEPTVAIVDLRLPDGSGLEIVKSLRAQSADMGIVVLTMYAGDNQLFDALEAGASAFVPKSAPAEEIVAAAHHAASAPRSFTAADLADALTSKLFCDEDAISSTHWGHEESNRGERERASRREKASRGGRWGMADFDEKTHVI